MSLFTEKRLNHIHKGSFLQNVSRNQMQHARLDFQKCEFESNATVKWKIYDVLDNKPAFLDSL